MKILVNAFGIQDSGGIRVLEKMLKECRENSQCKYYIYVNNNINISKLIKKIIFYIDYTMKVLYLFVIYAVTLLRAYYYLVSHMSVASISCTLTKILHLEVDRWIGIEGLILVCSYENKSFELFFNTLTAFMQSINNLPEDVEFE